MAQECTQQVKDYYRDPDTGVFRASSSAAANRDEYVDRRCFPHRKLQANGACSAADQGCCPTPPQPTSLAAQNLLSCASDNGWPSLGDMMAALALSRPPPLPQPDCDEDPSYPLDCAVCLTRTFSLATHFLIQI